MTDATRKGARAKAKAPARAAVPAKKPPAKKTGRPSLYTDEVAARICDGLSQGIPLTVICADPGMPNDDTVRLWATKNDELARAIARARELGYDKIAMDALRIADSPVEGKRIKRSEDGTEEVIEDMLGHRKLQVETRLKLLAKWDPKRYGEKVTQEVTGPGGGPLQHSLAVRFVAGEAVGVKAAPQTAPDSRDTKDRG